jgi:hypothetical protein
VCGRGEDGPGSTQTLGHRWVAASILNAAGLHHKERNQMIKRKKLDRILSNVSLGKELTTLYRQLQAILPSPSHKWKISIFMILLNLGDREYITVTYVRARV